MKNRHDMVGFGFLVFVIFYAIYESLSFRFQHFLYANLANSVITMIQTNTACTTMTFTPDHRFFSNIYALEIFVYF